MAWVSDAFEVRPGRAGWRTATIVKLLVMAVWTAFWVAYTVEASDTFSVLLSAVAAASGLCMFLQGLEHPFVEFELRIDGDAATITRRSPFRTKRWHAPLQTVEVGAIDVHNDEPGSSPGYGAHRFIAICMGAETVRFMDGYPNAQLQDVREMILPQFAARQHARG